MTVASATPIASAASPTGFGAFLTQILSDRDQFFGEVAEGVQLRSKLVHALWTLAGLSALYGAAAGASARASARGSRPDNATMVHLNFQTIRTRRVRAM